MLKAKCIEKIRDKNNHIIGYTIIGDDKKPIPVKSEKLKEVIRSGLLEVTNLTLTSDNRLIDRKPVTPSKSTTTSSKSVNTSSKQNINIENLIRKAKSMGYTFNTFDTDCGHKCYIASSPDNTKHLFLIPDDVKYIYKTNANFGYVEKEKIYKYISNIRGALKVVGGKGLVSTSFMFHSCKVHSLDLSSFNTSNVTDMRWMFDDCKAQSIDLTSFNTGNVTDMHGMFYDCEAQSINLTSFDTGNVTNMNGMFYGCKAQLLDLSSFNTSNVTDMCGMFEECKAQIKVNDDKLKAELHLDSFFEPAQKASTPSKSKATHSKHKATHSKPKITPSKPNINVEATFNKAKTLGYNIKEFDTACGHKCYIASSQDNTKHLLLIPDDVEYIDDGNYVYRSSAYDNYDTKLSKNTSNIEGTLKVVGGKGLIATISMFYDCKVQSLDLKSFDTSNVENMNNMFSYCRAQSIDLGSFNTSKVIDMSFMFYGCEARSLDLSSFDTSNVEDMSQMFRSCRAQSLDLTSFNTSKAKYIFNMFNDCGAKSIDLTSFDTSNVTDMSCMFQRCEARSLDLRSFDTSKVTDMASMFSGCEARSIDLSSFDTSKVEDMTNMFSSCEAYSLDLRSFDTHNADIGCMFDNCSAEIKTSDTLKADLQAQLQEELDYEEYYNSNDYGLFMTLP